MSRQIFKEPNANIAHGKYLEIVNTFTLRRKKDFTCILKALSLDNEVLSDGNTLCCEVLHELLSEFHPVGQVQFYKRSFILRKKSVCVVWVGVLDQLSLFFSS